MNKVDQYITFYVICFNGCIHVNEKALQGRSCWVFCNITANKVASKLTDDCVKLLFR